MLNSSYDDDNTLHDRESASDREISVGTSSIVGIFFVLALICAAFFGIGYTLGGRQSQPATFSPPVAATTTSSATKPSPGSPAKDDSASQSGSKPYSEATSAASSPSSSAAGQVAPGKRVDVPEASASPATKATTAPSVVASAPAASATPIIVQIAAVSHREDADVLISALSRRGYTVVIRQEPQDKLFHVQIGPFANRKDADAMRQRLLADGYNAIVK
jgi:DedD protein